jgi:hypothetical protein
MHNKEGTATPLVFAGVLVVLLPVAYVLSDGPAIWLEIHGYIHPNAYETFYAPLIWACGWSPFEEALVWYESWFYTDEMLRAIYPERYS